MKLLKPAWIHHGGNGKPIMSADIHPDGSRLATGGQGENGGLIVLWNMEPVRSETAENDADVPKVLTRLQAHTGCVNCVRWSHSGMYLASCSDDRIVMIWQLVGRIVPVKQPTAGQNGDTKKSSQSQSASSAFGGASIETWRCAHSLTGHRGDVLHVDWSVRDELLASASVDNTAIIWSVARGERLATLNAHSGFVKGISFDPIGKYVATQSDDRTLRVWRTSDWRCEAVISAPFHDCDSTTHVLRLAWAADGRSIMSAHAMNNRFPVVQLIDRSDWRLSVDLVGHRKAVTVVRVLPLILRRTLDAAGGGKDGEDNYEQCSAVGSRDRSISIWLNSLKRPLVVLHDLFTDSVLDLAWNVNRGTPSQASSAVTLELVATSYDGSIAFVSIDEHELVNRRVATRDATDAYLRSIYGSNVPAFRDCATFTTANGHADPAAQRGRLIEHADVLELHSRSNNLQNDQRASVQAQPARPKETHVPRPTEQCEIRTKDGRRRITPAFVANLLTTVEPITPTLAVRPADQMETSVAPTDKKNSEETPQTECDTNADKSKSLGLPNAISPSKIAMNANSLADVFDEVIADSVPKSVKDLNAATLALTPQKAAPDSGKPPLTAEKQQPAESDKDKEKEKEKLAAPSASGTMKRKLADTNSSAREREKEKERPPVKKPVVAAVDAHEKPSHVHDHDTRDVDRHVGAAVPTTPTLTPGSTLADALLRAYLSAARLKSASSEGATCSFTVPIPVSSSSTTEATAAPSDSDISRGTLSDQLLVETGTRTCKLSRVAHARNAEEQSDAQTQLAARWSVLLDGRIVALAMDSGAQLVCAARADATLQLRELDSGSLAALPILLDAVVSHVQFIDSRYLLAVTELGTVTMWRVVPDTGEAFSSPVFGLASGCGLGACLNSTVSIQSLVCREPIVADVLRHAALRFACRVPLSVRVNDVSVTWAVRDERLLIARAAVTLNGAAMRTLAVFATDSRTLHAFSTDVVHIASFCNVSFLNAACSKLERPAVTFGNFDIIPLRSAFERCASYLDRFANDVPSASKDLRGAPGSFGEAVANEREHAAANRLRVVEELICFAKLSRDDASLKRWFALYVHCVVQSCVDESDRAAQSLAAAFNKHVINCAPATAGLLRFATDVDRRRYATLLLGLIGANVQLQRLYQALKFTFDSSF